MPDLPTLDDCVHCGLCLEACPTYAISGREIQNPRGRIAALRNLEEGSESSSAIESGLDDCLVCRACESACPAGISMEKLMSHHRERRIDRPVRANGTNWRAALERFFLREILPSAPRRRAALQLLAWGAPLARALRLPLELPIADRTRHSRFRPLPWPRLEPSGRRLGRVGLYLGCVTEFWLREEHEAAIRVLVRNGWEVVPITGECCGALHEHAGERSLARACRARSRRALDAERVDVIVSDTAGCAAVLLERSGDGVPVLDTLTLLARYGFERPTPLEQDWGVAPPCHHRHSSLPEEGVRTVLDAILERGYRELPGPDHCCGAAGLFMLRNPRLSAEIGKAAEDRYEASDFCGVATGNAGCLIRWESLLGPSRVVHPVVLLDRAYQTNPSSPRP